MAGDKTRREGAQDQVQRVRDILASFESSVPQGFDEDDVLQLRVLVRLTVEFHDYLASSPTLPKFPGDTSQNLLYAIESILSGIDSFVTVTQSYGALIGARKSEIVWGTVTAGSLKDEFLGLYRRFLPQSVFEKKCRLLLDMFKLQIVFAGMFYDCEP